MNTTQMYILDDPAHKANTKSIAPAFPRPPPFFFFFLTRQIRTPYCVLPLPYTIHYILCNLREEWRSQGSHNQGREWSTGLGVSFSCPQSTLTFPFSARKFSLAHCY